jgi:hypothetical protein
LSEADIRSRFVLSYVWELPFGRGKAFLNRGRMLDAVLGGWQLSGVTTLQTGGALTITAPGDTGNVGLTSRPNRVCDGSLDDPTVDRWFDTGCFVAPAPFTFGNSGRGILSGPGMQNWDAGIMKRFSITEGHFLQFRWEMFNSLNQVSYGNPGTTLNTPGFGRVVSAASARGMQLGLKYGF